MPLPYPSRTMVVPKSYQVRSIPVAIEANKVRTWYDFKYTIFTFREGMKTRKRHFMLPPMMSSSSLVMACWRPLLYCLVRS